MNNAIISTDTICDICETAADSAAHVETHDVNGVGFAIPSVICSDCWKHRPGRFAIEIERDGTWVPCVCDDVLVEYGSRDDAETDARYNFANSETWRVVEVQS